MILYSKYVHFDKTNIFNTIIFFFNEIYFLIYKHKKLNFLKNEWHKYNN